MSSASVAGAVVGIAATAVNAASSESRRHRRRRSGVYWSGSLSMSLAQFWHSQSALSIALRSSMLIRGSYRGPPGAAAQIWAATPMLTALRGSVCGPLVGRRQLGFEHWRPTLFATTSFVSLENSSRVGMIGFCVLHPGHVLFGFQSLFSSAARNGDLEANGAGFAKELLGIMPVREKHIVPGVLAVLVHEHPAAPMQVNEEVRDDVVGLPE